MKTLFIALAMVFSIQSQAQQTTTFTIEGMTCGACANTATNILRNLDGVDSAKVDFKTKQAIVIGTVTKSEIQNTIKEKTNFEALFDGDSLPEPLTEEEKKDLDIQTIKGGNKIDFKDHLSSGKITLFDFYADWCGPCRVFSPKIEHYIKKNPNVALRKVDIVDWKSALSKQLTSDYKMPALPFTLIFDDKGNLLGKVEGNDIEKVNQIITQSKK